MTEEPTTSIIGRLDENTVAELARVICGDDSGLYYRKGWELERFLRKAGWDRVPPYDGEYRREWITARLTERQEDPAELEKVLLRLASPLEYLDDPQCLPEVIAAVNTFLVYEGCRLETPGGRPRLLACDPALSQLGGYAPADFKGTMTDIVQDPAMAALLQRRRDEAHVCDINGAHVAAIIMLGSLLEGVLLQVIVERDITLLGRTEPDKMNLKKLIEICLGQRWIDRDMDHYSHTLREYRNFVHPRKEIREEHTPDSDTVGVAWKVVNGVFNDLLATR
ncbi:hypothetical protein SUDANB171_03117 [Streptomyces sp. enrichment culture]|uniref:hypothetical protein n=1 Tax=Streptomyces sp. enrichment culture TaxID=1795815 RepID=UPI003F5579CB